MKDLFETIFNTVSDGIAIYNNEGRFLEVNPITCQFLGYSKDELLQMRTLDLIPSELREKASKQIAEKLGKGGGIVEMVCRCKDGSLMPIELNIQPIKYNGIWANIAVIRDVTERKLAETELEKSREQFMLAVKGSQDGIWDYNLRDKNLYLSSRCKEMIGYEDQELPSVLSVLEEIIHPDDKQRVLDIINEYFNGAVPEFNIEFRVMHRDGSFKWIQVRGASLRDESGTAYRIAGSITDITERKQNEIKIAEDAVRRRILVEQSTDGIVIIDQNGKVFEANQKYADMLGYSSEEVLDLHIWDWDIHFTREELIGMIRNVDESGGHFETFHKRKDGTFLDVDISSNAAMFGEQKLILCVCRDITERKQAEKELLNAKLEAEAANWAKSEFLANMSHELRTPLNSIIGFSDILSIYKADELTEEQLRYASNISESGKHLLDLINDILDLSKIEAGRMELHRESFSVNELLGSITVLMEPLTSRKNISVGIENNIQNDEMLADRQKFKQIMYNLLSNAIKFTPDNGKISVTAKKTDYYIQVSVSDTGIGIPDDCLKEIFNPFSQADTSKNRIYGGTGLGLALVKRFVEMHDGNIEVESEEGKGSTFTFTIAGQDYC